MWLVWLLLWGWCGGCYGGFSRTAALFFKLKLFQTETDVDITWAIDLTYLFERERKSGIEVPLLI